ncbi:unnamed protein product [Hymenolepis diminuta]|uniref:SH3 domain-containing protein n=1 Tax=Hymenolepis diminuta TaxID=6216 RepID=A0A0R3SGG8_HYMDI|nr:unnamed protein product [Hymenolepis diminuta]
MAVSDDASKVDFLLADLACKITDCSIRSSQWENACRIEDKQSEVALRNAWNKVRNSAVATQYHLENAAGYHHFNFKCGRLQYLLGEFWNNTLRETDPFIQYDSFNNLLNARDFGNFLQAKFIEIKKYLYELNRLCVKSELITPLRKSVQPTESTDLIKGVILCDFWDEANDIYLRRGQYVKLCKTNLSASGSESVQVIRLEESEKEIAVPSVYIGLTDRDCKSVELANRMYEEFLDIWSKEIDKWLVEAIAIFHSFLDLMLKDEAVCFEDFNLVMHLLNEIELAFPQREASVMNNTIFDKINLVRTKYMDFDTSTSDPFPSNFFLDKQRISEESQKIAREHVYGYFAVIKNLKEQMLTFNYAKSYPHHEKKRNEWNTDPIIKESEYLVSAVEQLATELERVRNELASISTVKDLQIQLHEHVSTTLSQLSISNQELFEECRNHIRRSIIDIQNIMNETEFINSTEGVTNPIFKVCPECKNKVYTGYVFERNSKTITQKGTFIGVKKAEKRDEGIQINIPVMLTRVGSLTAKGKQFEATEYEETTTTTTVTTHTKVKKLILESTIPGKGNYVVNLNIPGPRVLTNADTSAVAEDPLYKSECDVLPVVATIPSVIYTSPNGMAVHSVEMSVESRGEIKPIVNQPALTTPLVVNELKSTAVFCSLPIMESKESRSKKKRGSKEFKYHTVKHGVSTETISTRIGFEGSVKEIRSRKVETKQKLFQHRIGKSEIELKLLERNVVMEATQTRIPMMCNSVTQIKSILLHSQIQTDNLDEDWISSEMKVVKADESLTVFAEAESKHLQPKSKYISTAVMHSTEADDRFEKGLAFTEVRKPQQKKHVKYKCVEISKCVDEKTPRMLFAAVQAPDSCPMEKKDPRIYEEMTMMENTVTSSDFECIHTILTTAGHRKYISTSSMSARSVDCRSTDWRESIDNIAENEKELRCTRIMQNMSLKIGSLMKEDLKASGDQKVILAVEDSTQKFISKTKSISGKEQENNNGPTYKTNDEYGKSNKR